MLFLVSGASGAGKSTVRKLIAPRLGDDFEAVELYHLGTLENVTLARRQELAEVAARRAATLAREGRHLLLSGDPVAPGEIIAAPSAVEIGGIAICILDTDAKTQEGRLRERGDDLADLHLHIAFADWMREHATDPSPRLDVIKATGSPVMKWERLSTIEANDPRWRVRLIDTSGRAPEDVAGDVMAWIERAKTDPDLVMRPEAWD